MCAICTTGFDVIQAALVVDIDAGRDMKELLFAFQVSRRMLQAPSLNTIIDQGIVQVEDATMLDCIRVPF